MNRVFCLIATACCFLASATVGIAENLVPEKWEALEIALDGGENKIDRPFGVELRAIFRSGGGERFFEMNGWLGIKRPDGIESPMVVAILSEKK